MDKFAACVLTGTDGVPLLLTRPLAARVGIIRRDGYTGTILRLENETDGPAFLTVQEDVRTVVQRLARAIENRRHESDVEAFNAAFPDDDKILPSRRPTHPPEDAEFLANRLRRVARMVGLTYSTMTNEEVAEVAGSILGEIARKLARQSRDGSGAPGDE